MLRLLLLAALPGLAAASRRRLPGAPLRALPVDVALAPSGAFTLSVSGAPYFASGPTYVRAGGRLYSSADGSLALSSPPSAPAPGSDALGAFLRQQLTWSAGGAPVVTAVRVYAAAGAAVFETIFPAGLNATAAPAAIGSSGVASAWPSFALDAADADRAAVAFGGRFLEESRAVAWGAAASDGLPSAGSRGGPLIVFNRARTASLVVSSLTHHAVATSAVDGARTAAAAVSYGLIGTVTSILIGHC